MKRAFVIFSIFSITCIASPAFSQAADRIMGQHLVDFLGKPQQNAIAISWKTITPATNVAFNIQRSKDAEQWEDIGKVMGSTAQPSQYSFTDANPKEKLFYYRLKIEQDGSIEYSSMITVKTGLENNKTIVFPNPTKNVIWIKPEEALYQDFLDLEIYNIVGEKVYASKMAGSDTKEIDMSSYNNGYYCVKIGNKSYRVLKQ